MEQFSKKKHSEEIYEELTHKMILAALGYRTEFLTDANDKLSADAAAEIIYFFMYWFDRTSFQIFNEEKRNEVYIIMRKHVVSGYIKAILKPDTPQHFLDDLSVRMLKNLNERQKVYSQCVCCLGTKEGYPFAGTMEFALSFYIYKALGKTNRDNIENILTGKEKVKKEDLVDLPNYSQTITDSIFIRNALNSSKMPKLIKEL